MDSETPNPFQPEPDPPAPDPQPAPRGPADDSDIQGVLEAALEDAMAERSAEPAPADPASGVTVAAPDGTPPGEDGFRKFLRAIVRWFDARQLGGARAALIGAGLCAIAGVSFAISHPGFAGVIGLLGVFMLWVAGAPREAGPPRTPRRRPFVDLLAGVSDLCLVGGLALAGASTAPIHVFLAVCVLGLLMLLPRAVEGAAGRDVDLWSPDERRLVLLVSAVFGHTVVPLVLIIVVGTTDLTVRLLRTYAALRTPPDPEPLPPGLSALYLPDGRPHPGVRIAAALVVVLLLVILPSESGWQF